MLLAVDDIQALYGKTLYRDPQFVPIHSYHLSLPRLIMEYASGKRVFVRSVVALHKPSFVPLYVSVYIAKGRFHGCDL